MTTTTQGRNELPIKSKSAAGSAVRNESLKRKEIPSAGEGYEHFSSGPGSIGSDAIILASGL
jgi:hypothetical protein